METLVGETQLGRVRTLVGDPARIDGRHEDAILLEHFPGLSAWPVTPGGAAGNRTRYKNCAACGNAEFDDADNNVKVREMTCGYTKGVDGVNTKGAPRFFNQSHW